MRPRTSPPLPTSPDVQIESDQRVWDVAKAIEAALDGAFTNSITANGLMWLAARRDSLRQRWLAP